MNDYNINLESVQQLTPDTYYPSSEFYPLFDQKSDLHGNSQKGFNRRLGLYCTFEYNPETHLYYIEDIYTIPLPPTRDTKYDRQIKILLTNYLATCTDNSATMTQKRWWYKLNMVNNHFLSLKGNKIEIPEDLISEIRFGIASKESMQFDISILYNNAASRFSKIFERALDRLDKECLINYKRTYLIKENDWYRTANEAEEDSIRYIQREVLKKMGIPDLGRLHRMKETTQKLFYKNCLELYLDYNVVRETNSEIYKAIQVRYDHEQMEQAAKEEVEAAGADLNRLCVEWACNWAAGTGTGINKKFMPYAIDYYIKIN